MFESVMDEANLVEQSKSKSENQACLWPSTHQTIWVTRLTRTTAFTLSIVIVLQPRELR